MNYLAAATFALGLLAGMVIISNIGACLACRNSRDIDALQADVHEQARDTEQARQYLIEVQQRLEALESDRDS